MVERGKKEREKQVGERKKNGFSLVIFPSTAGYLVAGLVYVGVIPWLICGVWVGQWVGRQKQKEWGREEEQKEYKI